MPPLTGSEPCKGCGGEKALGNPAPKTHLARPHAERAELVQEEHGLALVLALLGVEAVVEGCDV